MNTYIKSVISVLVLALCAITVPADEAPAKQQEVIVHIQQDAPKTAADKTVVQKADEWVEFGEHLGKAFDAGLTSLTDHAEKFSHTDAGRFTMFVIAWKVVGKDATNLLHHLLVLPFGIFAELTWFCFYVYIVRRFCCAYSIKTKASGPFWKRDVQYETVDVLSADGKVFCFFGITIAFFIISLVLVFNLIM